MVLEILFLTALAAPAIAADVSSPLLAADHVRFYGAPAGSALQIDRAFPGRDEDLPRAKPFRLRVGVVRDALVPARASNCALEDPFAPTARHFGGMIVDLPETEKTIVRAYF